ncbi:MAG: N-acetylglucosamine-6-phosphate deacetylase [Bryobacteraceae bacterium]
MSVSANNVIGRVPGTSSVIRCEWHGLAVSAVDELISPPAIPQYLAPGLIDLQVNGFAGVDFNDPAISSEDLSRAIRKMFRTGVSRFFPTIITGSEERITACLRNLSSAKAEFLRHGLAEGHAMEAFHVEGPHISPENGPRGAHRLEHVRPPDPDEFKRWQEAADGDVRIVTFSPEWDAAPRYVAELVKAGVVPSIGHTKADANAIEAAVQAGASMSTHLGNAAHSVLPKTQNYIWNQLSDDRLAASFIYDEIHIPRDFFRSAVRAKGIDRSVLVTDAVMPAMCLPGPYRLGEVEVELHENGSVLMRGENRLAGSALRMDRAIGNTVRSGGFSLHDALTMATINPARSGRVGGRQRGLTPGEKADFVVFEWDKTGDTVKISETIVAGQRVFQAET